MPNTEMRELWNGEAAQGWSTRAEQYDAMLAGLGTQLLAAADLRPGEQVLDVGCGAGQVLRQAAGIVGPQGRALGVDVSTVLVATADDLAKREGLAQVQVLEADAQVHTFGAPQFDAVISRFGVMFFDDPVAAFRNLRSAVVPRGRLAFVAWQSPLHNPWMLEPMGALVPMVGPPELPAPGAPGPFAFADAERVQALLEEAGWSDVLLEDLRTDVWVGGATTAEEAADFTAADAFGQMMLSKATAEQRAEAMVALRAVYGRHLVDGQVRLPAAVWLVTARQEG